MDNTIYNLMRSSRNISLGLYQKLVKLKGLWCTIKEPVAQNSIFGVEDLVDYDELQNERKKLLVYGLFQEAYIGNEEGYDSFIEGCYILTPYKEMIPRQSQVVIEFCGRTMTFKVDEHRNLLPTTCEQLFVKNILVPAT